MGRLLPFTLIALLGGCVPRFVPDTQMACSSAKRLRYGVSAKELAELSLGTPAQEQAISAWHQANASVAMASIGAAGLLSGFVLGFVLDGSVESRNITYGLVGASIGVGAASLILGLTSRSAQARAADRVRAWAQATCSYPEEPAQ